jgi:hypothetical protein
MLFVLTLWCFFAGGMRVSIVFAPLIVFLSLYNIGGFLSVMPIVYDRQVADVRDHFRLHGRDRNLLRHGRVLRDPVRILAVVRNAWVVAGLIGLHQRHDWATSTSSDWERHGHRSPVRRACSRTRTCWRPS